MKRLALLATAALLAGCADSATETVSTSGDAATDSTAMAAPETEVDSSPVTVSFESGETVNLAIPEMHCPFGCFPKAKDALEGIDGVASVELVEQEEEGVINDRRVVVTFDGNVDSTTAIAALDAAALPGSSFEEKTTSDN